MEGTSGGHKQSDCLPHAVGPSLRQLAQAHTEGKPTLGYHIHNSVLGEATGEAEFLYLAGDTSGAFFRLR